MKSMNFMFCSFGALIFLLLVVGSNFVAGAGDSGKHGFFCGGSAKTECLPAFKCFEGVKIGNGRRPDKGTTPVPSGGTGDGECICDPNANKYFDKDAETCSEHPFNGTGGHGDTCYHEDDEKAVFLFDMCIPALTCRIYGKTADKDGQKDHFGNNYVYVSKEGICVCGIDSKNPAWNDKKKKCDAEHDVPEPDPDTGNNEVSSSPKPNPSDSPMPSGSDGIVYASLSLSFGLVAAMGSFLILCTTV